MGQGKGAGAGDGDPEFGLCYLDAGGVERRELPASWPGLQPEMFDLGGQFRTVSRGRHHWLTGRPPRYAFMRRGRRRR